MDATKHHITAPASDKRFELLAPVTIWLVGADGEYAELSGTIIGRTFSEEPTYDIRVDDTLAENSIHLGLRAEQIEARP